MNSISTVVAVSVASTRPDSLVKVHELRDESEEDPWTALREVTEPLASIESKLAHVTGASR